MKSIRHLIILCVLAAVAVACTKPASLTLLSNQLTFKNAAGQQELSFLTNSDWSVSSDAAWLTVSPASGGASGSYQTVTVSAQANEAETERTAELTLRAGDQVRTVAVRQAGKPAVVTPEFNIRAFRAAHPDETTWYELTGEIAAICNDTYGNFFIFDETGYVYVYGLCEKQVGKGKNDQSFPKLGLKVGDKVTMMALRSEYDGNVEAGGATPAYFVSKVEGTYRLGRKVASTSAGWMELPATSATDGQDLLIHSFPGGKRSYAAYYDYDHYLSTWVAYPLCAGNMGSGTRTDFSLDPLLPHDKQQYNPSGYGDGNAGHFDRGHQIPSADRLDYRVNLETFFGTNMTPQDNNLNAGIWAELEKRVRGWAKKSDTDTLYVVTGCSLEGSTQYVLDGDNKKIPVPTGYYKALLRLAKDKSYSAVAFWFDNKPNSAGSIQKTMAMSVDELEKKVGVDFFVNLPADTQKSVEAQNPADVAWWWNN
ncbi:MAG: DNA/RNA non-specific endonuclease [Bacteroidales bacterium]|nr:DNA/RNA non-specific endonuclease [Bacteroidales bacterium]